jgi:transcriptional regulator with XRE-family HTH domain
MQLAARLRKLRTANGLTIREVANAIQVPISTYRDWEYAFNISLEKLMLGEEKQNPEVLKHLLAAKENIDAAIESAKAL